MELINWSFTVGLGDPKIPHILLGHSFNHGKKMSNDARVIYIVILIETKLLTRDTLNKYI